ncbi:MAG: DUF1616 domain-containing protein [Methanobacteriaceae archaeon]|nr:DUF1616 domain-containing protein [Methanobacteriaceae archaeon]
MFIISLICLIFTLNSSNNTIINAILYAVLIISIECSIILIINPKLSASLFIHDKPVKFTITTFIVIIVAISTIALFKINTNIPILALSILGIILSIIAFIRKNKLSEEINKKGLLMDNKEEITDHNSRIIYLIIILGILGIVARILPPYHQSFGWMVPGAFFICLIPGYLIINTIYPKKDDLAPLGRMGIAVGLSLFISAIIGLFFNPVNGVMLDWIMIIMIIISLIIVLPIFIKKTRYVNSKFFNKKLEYLLIIGVILTIILMAISGTLINNNSLTTNGNTTFQISGVNGTPGEDNYYNLTAGEKQNLKISTTNLENKVTNYTIKVVSRNETNSSEISEYHFELKNNETKEIEENLTMTSGKKDVQFILYKDGNETAYKIKHLYANVNE